MLLTIGLELTLTFISIKYLTPSLMKLKKIYCQYGRQTSQSKNQHSSLPKEAPTQAPWVCQTIRQVKVTQALVTLSQFYQTLKGQCPLTLQTIL